MAGRLSRAGLRWWACDGDTGGLGATSRREARVSRACAVRPRADAARSCELRGLESRPAPARVFPHGTRRGGRRPRRVATFRPPCARCVYEARLLDRRPTGGTPEEGAASGRACDERRCARSGTDGEGAVRWRVRCCVRGTASAGYHVGAPGAEPSAAVHATRLLCPRVASRTHAHRARSGCRTGVVRPLRAVPRCSIRLPYRSGSSASCCSTKSCTRPCRRACVRTDRSSGRASGTFPTTPPR